MASKYKSTLATEERKEDIFAFIARKREELRQNRMAKAYQFGTIYDDAEERIEAAKQQSRPDTL